MSNEEQNPESAPELSKSVYLERPGFFESVRGAVLNIKLYDTFRKVSTGSAASFFALFIFVIAIINTLDVSFSMSREFDTFARFYAASLPEIRIENNNKAAAVTNEPMPVKAVYSDAAGNTTILVDTSGKTTDLKDYENAVLISDTAIIRKTPGGKVVQYPIKDFMQPGTIINKDSILGIRNMILAKFFPFLLLIGYVIVLFLLFIQAGFFSLAGMLMARYMKLDIYFTGMLNLVMYSFVPAVLSVTLLNILGIFRFLNGIMGIDASRLVFMLVCYTIVVIYMSLALNTIKKNTAAAEDPDNLSGSDV
ncbi:MAG: DUF1189 domain-containing protein [Firmicutes bacterium]|nr:DUF1189 domain-containing protein [Bacillota bacterium]